MKCRDCHRTYPRHENWTVFDRSTGLHVSGYCATCGPTRAAGSDPSQTSTPVDVVPEERAPEVSAPQVPAPTDLATSTPDPAVDVAGTTGPTS